MKTKISIFFIALFSIIVSITNTVKAQESDPFYKQSKFKYSKLFLIETIGKKYYADSLSYSKESEFISFCEYKRNGKKRECHNFKLSECKIYKSK